jgi:hypothetical protein
MVEFSCSFCFTCEAGSAGFVLTEMRREEFEGLSIQLGIFGFLYRTHTALTDFGDYRIVGYGLTDHALTPG